MVINLRAGHLLRSVGWGLIWLFTHPELYSQVAWTSEPLNVFQSLVLYFVSGILLEVIYRKLVWGGLTQSMIYQPQPRFGGTKKQWVSLLESQPPKNVQLEVLCADGGIRRASTDQKVDGPFLMEIVYEIEVMKLGVDEQKKYLPIYWRHLE